MTDESNPWAVDWARAMQLRERATAVGCKLIHRDAAPKHFAFQDTPFPWALVQDTTSWAFGTLESVADKLNHMASAQGRRCWRCREVLPQSWGENYCPRCVGKFTGKGDAA